MYKKSSQIKLFERHRTLSIVSCVHLPIEFLLLLSPERDIASPVLFPRILVLDAIMLGGRDRRFSRSTSDRSGRFGVNCKIQI